MDAGASAVPFFAFFLMLSGASAGGVARVVDVAT
jgi:hypothetical protein